MYQRNNKDTNKYFNRILIYVFFNLTCKLHRIWSLRTRGFLRFNVRDLFKDRSWENLKQEKFSRLVLWSALKLVQDVF